MRADHQLCVGLDASLDLVRLDVAFGVAGREVNLDAAVAREVIERSQDGVVLEHRRDHVIARLQGSLDQGVECIRCVVGEAEPARVAASEEVRQLPARRLDDLTTGAAEVIARAPGIDSVVLVDLHDAIEDRGRLRIDGGRIVQVDDLAGFVVREVQHLSPSLICTTITESVDRASAPGGTGSIARWAPRRSRLVTIE